MKDRTKDNLYLLSFILTIVMIASVLGGQVSAKFLTQLHTVLQWRTNTN